MNGTVKCESIHCNELSVLFNDYRVFYGQNSDLDSARNFISERLDKSDSVIFAAFEENIMCGFVQLYPSFSSVAMKRTYYLNDLFVSADFRKKGIAEALINKSIEFAKENSAARITLCTQIDNDAAKNLYNKCGFIKNTAYDYFNFAL
ncbi:MAG: GNAT family N-acetyltransferase [Spirochaetes bacterium]|nr:GNAT family N-acetyltransferase [Spirochaetota bacterium]